ncbi:MAG: Rieske (2Fe-2S) protein [Chlorobi bacterium]|nr:Rieske (2Fe-2S) protein [Chlorobiota bacterium]
MGNNGRRKFITALLSIGGLGTFISAFYPVVKYMTPVKSGKPSVSSLKLGKLSDFAKNAWEIVRFGRKPLIIINDENGKLHALSAECTHLDCIVQYSKEEKMIICACHNGHYDLNGKNISGPPPRPLKQYKVNIQNGEIIITKKEDG